jgi:hypothetical protein
VKRSCREGEKPLYSKVVVVVAVRVRVERLEQGLLWSRGKREERKRRARREEGAPPRVLDKPRKMPFHAHE